MKRIYISGQITGLPFERAQAKFAAAEKTLAEQGYQAISPLKNGIPRNFPWESHIAMDIVLLIGCDAAYFLPDWNLSRGATLEKNIAELTGKQIIYEKAPIFVDLKQAISEVMGVSFYEIASEDRKRNHVYARMIYAHFCRKQGASLADLSAEMKRNHSTVIYYLKKYADECKFNPLFRELAEKVNNRLGFYK